MMLHTTVTARIIDKTWGTILVARHGALILRKSSSLTDSFFLTMTAVQSSSSGITFILAVAFFFRQWEVPFSSGNFLTSSDGCVGDV
uniref:Uncharacterized protein n=1 Tax=Tanacetum cinerariifolium TaxID=118510 RepID=A0A699UPJ5_TANCI|nr:hypothetical protein [Tanacetum cinerariifolium]